MKTQQLIIGVGIGFVLYVVVLRVFNRDWRASSFPIGSPVDIQIPDCTLGPC